MIKILVSEGVINPQIMKYPSKYSIINTVQTINLSVGWNEFDDLKCGFYFCDDLIFNSSIEKIDLSEYDTSDITNMSSMFSRCTRLKELDTKKFNTLNVTDMRYMFHKCVNLVELDLSSFDTRNVTVIDSMFDNCLSLVRLDLSNFNMKNIRTFSDMFYNCERLKYIKCTKEFKKWCLKNQYEIDLPSCLCEGGDGVWDIID